MNHQIDTLIPLQLSVSSSLLIVAAGHVGNNIFCTPAIQLLRKALPHILMDVVVLNSKSACVFENSDMISQVHVVRTPRQMARLSARYDQVVCLHPKSDFLLKDVAVPIALMPPFDLHRHYAEQILAFASSLVGKEVEDSDRRYHLAGTAADRLDTPSSRKLLQIGIHLGCGRTAIHGWKFFYRKRDSHPKLWPTESYVALAERLRQLFPDVRFVITGTRNERFLARRFSKSMKDIVDLTGKTSLVELKGIINKLDLFITQDCGVLHVAAATSTPLVALFGPTDPALTGPWPLVSHHRILQGASMAEITPQMVAGVAVEILQKHQAAVPEIIAPTSKEVISKLMVVSVLWLQLSDFLTCGYAASLCTGLL